MTRATRTYSTAVVIVPPEELWEPIQRIRRKHDEKVRRWMPHITLIYPFVPRERSDAVAERLLAACRTISPFQLELAAIRTFRHQRGRFTMWLDPEPNEPVAQLYGALWRATWDEPVPSGGRPFRPHLSIGQVRGQSQMHELVDQLQFQWRPLGFLVDRVSMIWRRDPPDDIFRIDRQIPLGPASET